MIQYMGGKFRLRKQISSVLKSLRSGQPYWEPFVGGAWILQEMDGIRFASDVNQYLITMYQHIQKGWIPPDEVTKETYDHYLQHPDSTDPMTGFVGFCASYRAKFFGGFEGKGRVYNGRYQETIGPRTARKSILQRKESIRDVKFSCGFYSKAMPKNMFIYCDPPYQGTTTYQQEFDHSLFWNTMRTWSAANVVVVSEYLAPEDFKVIAEFPSFVGIAQKDQSERRVEKLFTL